MNSPLSLCSPYWDIVYTRVFTAFSWVSHKIRFLSGLLNILMTKELGVIMGRRHSEVIWDNLVTIMISITIAGVIESILCSCGNKQKQIAVDERWNFTDWIRNDPYFFFFQIYICPLKNPCFFSSLKSIFYWNNKWCQYLYWNVCILVNPLMLINPGFQPDEWGTNRIIIFLWPTHTQGLCCPALTGLRQSL